MDGFGERLRQLRKSHDITQGQLAECIGVVPSAVGKYERITGAYPSVDVLIKLADYFNVSIDYLLRGATPTTSIENNITGSMSNSPVIQGNNGAVVLHGHKQLTPESAELLRIYENLGGRDRLKLLNFALEVERCIIK